MMGRILVPLILLVALAAVAVFIASAIHDVALASRMAATRVMEQSKGAIMGPSGIRKTAFVVLICLMAGLASGLIGGL